MRQYVRALMILICVHPPLSAFGKRFWKWSI